MLLAVFVIVKRTVLKRLFNDGEVEFDLTFRVRPRGLHGHLQRIESSPRVSVRHDHQVGQRLRA